MGGRRGSWEEHKTFFFSFYPLKKATSALALVLLSRSLLLVVLTVSAAADYSGTFVCLLIIGGSPFPLFFLPIRTQVATGGLDLL
jgi:predicted ABC-type exoprotein transport system permease subunit